MANPFGELIGLQLVQREAGTSEFSLEIQPHHMNPHGVAHGAVLYALADTGMGAALYTLLEPGEICATIEIKINYFRAVTSGTVTCKAAVQNRGRTVANLEARLYLDEQLVGLANGNFAIFRPRTADS